MQLVQIECCKNYHCWWILGFFLSCSCQQNIFRPDRKLFLCCQANPPVECPTVSDMRLSLVQLWLQTPLPRSFWLCLSETEPLVISPRVKKNNKREREQNQACLSGISFTTLCQFVKAKSIFKTKYRTLMLGGKSASPFIPAMQNHCGDMRYIVSICSWSIFDEKNILV